MDCCVCHKPIAEARLKRFPGVTTCSLLCTAKKYRPQPVDRLVISKDCENCRNAIPTRRLTRCPWVKTCSPECTRKRNSLLWRQKNPRPIKLATGTVGAVSELRVATDLLQRGYAVFRALSPNCPCDLAILYGDRLLRVEVKTASLSTSGTPMYGTIRNGNSYDILAAAMSDGIIYIPELASLFQGD